MATKAYAEAPAVAEDDEARRPRADARAAAAAALACVHCVSACSKLRAAVWRAPAPRGGPRNAIANEL